MNKYINLLIISLFFTGGLFAQQANNGNATPDFFKDPKKFFCWNGPLSSSYKNPKKHISDVPLIHYYDEKKGAARIICKPNYGFDKWKIIIRQNKSREQQKVKEIATNKNEQKNFTVYAFFMEHKYLVDPTEKPNFPNEKEMDFPAPIHVYKKEGEKWKHLTKLNIKDWSAFSDLQMKYLEL